METKNPNSQSHGQLFGTISRASRFVLAQMLTNNSPGSPYSSPYPSPSPCVTRYYDIFGHSIKSQAASDRTHPSPFNISLYQRSFRPLLPPPLLRLLSLQFRNLSLQLNLLVPQPVTSSLQLLYLLSRRYFQLPLRRLHEAQQSVNVS